MVRKNSLQSRGRKNVAKETKEQRSCRRGRKGVEGTVNTVADCREVKQGFLLKGLWDWPLGGHQSLRGQWPLGGTWALGGRVA